MKTFLIHSPRRPKPTCETIITRYNIALLLICDVIQAFSNFLFRLVFTKPLFELRYFPQVIGDKKAAQASGILINTEGIDSIKKLEQKLGVQVKFIHVIRNPFDNIATMALRRANERKKGQEILKVTTMCPVPDVSV